MRIRPTGTPENEALGRLVRRVRKRIGLSQVKLAQRLGQPQSFVSKIERGERHLEVVMFIEIAQILGESPLDLLGRYMAGESSVDED